MSHRPLNRTAQESLALSEEDTFPMGAPNKQPSGPKGGMKAPHTHAPHSTGMNTNAGDGKGGEVKRGSTPPKNKPNKNRLH